MCAQVLYNVDVFVDRQLLAERAADDLPPEDCVRVKAKALQRLAARLPEYPMPDPLPVSHRAAEEEDRENEQRENQRREEGDDPPPPIPDDYEEVEWRQGETIKHFMLWTKIDDALRWYQACTHRRL